MIKIDVVVDELQWKNKIKRPKAFFQAILKLFPKKYNFKTKNKAFSLLLSNNKKIKILNKKFRKKNKSTDVLSFPNILPGDLKLIKENNIYIGDIAASYEIINKRSLKNNFNTEFDKVWVHGLLHLIGYDHIKNKDYYKMNKIEKRILSSI